jgi:hypothetical protein
MAHTLVSQILEIADDARNDWVERNGERVTDNETVQRSRLRVESRKWAAAKLLPKVYGDRLQQEVSGPGGGPMQVDTALTAAALEAVRARLPKVGEVG